MKKHTVLIDGKLIVDSPRYHDWNYIMDGDEVPLASKHASIVNMEEAGKAEVLPIAVDRLRPVQRERLAQHLHKRFGMPLTEAYRQVDREFMIRTEDVRIVEKPRNFL